MISQIICKVKCAGVMKDWTWKCVLDFGSISEIIHQPTSFLLQLQAKKNMGFFPLVHFQLLLPLTFRALSLFENIWVKEGGCIKIIFYQIRYNASNGIIHCNAMHPGKWWSNVGILIKFSDQCTLSTQILGGISNKLDDHRPLIVGKKYICIFTGRLMYQLREKITEKFHYMCAH